VPQPYAWSRVVRASVTLTPTAKLVWDEIRCLDQGDGCWATSKYLAYRLGVAAETVEDLRLALLKQGLLVKEVRQGRVAWLVRLPVACLPSRKDPGDDEVRQLVLAFDQHLGGVATGPAPVPRVAPRRRRAVEPAPIGSVLEALGVNKSTG
jgi:hypothetical protein